MKKNYQTSDRRGFGSRFKNIWSLLLRLLVAGLLLGFLFSNLDYEKITKVVQQVNYTWLGSAFFLLITIRLIMALRWYIVLRAYSIQANIFEVLEIFFTSMFLGQMLPGLIGADMIRGYKLMKSHGKKKTIAVTLLADRLLGLSMVLIFALAGILWANAADKFWSTPALAIVLTGIVSLLGGWLFSDRLIKVIESFKSLGQSKVAKLYNKLLQVAIVLGDKKLLKDVLPITLLLSSIIMITRSFVFYCLFHAFGAGVQLIKCLAFIPLVFLIMMIPITIGGLGVREGALVILFDSVTQEISVSVGLVCYALMLVISIPGAILWLLSSSSSNITYPNGQKSQSK